MTAITSQHNPRLKELRKLQRRRERDRSGLFLAEGEDLVMAAMAAGSPAVEGYRATGTAIGGAGFEEVDPGVLASVSTLGSGTRAIGVYEQRFTQAAGPLCVCLWGVGDPGNVGTVLRGALAFGASCVALGPGCADPHSPKAVRASMGAIFAVGLARVSDVSELPGERVALVAGTGEPIERVALVAGADEPIERVALVAGADEPIGRIADVPAAASLSTRDAASAERRGRGREGGSPTVTLLVGAERDGLPDEVVAACERVAHIPIASESLNAAMAATVALYEMTRGGRDNDDRVPTA